MGPDAARCPKTFDLSTRIDRAEVDPKISSQAATPSDVAKIRDPPMGTARVTTSAARKERGGLPLFKNPYRQPTVSAAEDFVTSQSRTSSKKRTDLECRHKRRNRHCPKNFQPAKRSRSQEGIRKFSSPTPRPLVLHKETTRRCRPSSPPKGLARRIGLAPEGRENSEIGSYSHKIFFEAKELYKNGK